ncbi:MAG: ABC transporter permease [Clostridiales Family XIII bacterium]|nr:ABC transporter permease [Clostridiales Family XIII bacterium]
MLLSIISDHIVWRHQIFKLAKSDMIKTYTGAALGWAWAVIKPSVTIFVFWFAFSIGLRMGGPIEGYPFLLWLTAGMIPWFYMLEMITGGTGAFTKYSFLITKMKFPVATIPTFVGISKLFIHICLMALVVGLFLLHGYKPDIYYLQLPIYMLLMLLIFINVALFEAALSAMSKDFMNLVNSFTNALFWLSGIMFDVHEINIHWLRVLLMFNPVTFIASGYRNVFIYKVWIWEQPQEFLLFIGALVVTAVLGIWSFKRLYKEIPDVL